MKPTSAYLAKWLSDLAVRIAPTSHKDWAAAMRAELPHIETGKWSWAMGSLLTAFSQNLGAKTVSGKVRLVAGGLVAGLGLMVIPLVTGGDTVAMGIGAYNPLQPVILTVLLTVTGLLLFGGASLLLARMAPSLESAGRWLFGFGALGYALLQFSIIFYARVGHYPLTWLHLDAVLASFAFAGAGIALVARSQRVYWPFAIGTTIYSLLEAIRILLRAEAATPYIFAVNALMMSVPSLLLLAGGSLLTQPTPKPVKR